MGRLYAFELLFPQRQLRPALGALARRAAAGQAGCRVDFPGEEPLPVPFAGECEDGELTELRVGQREPWPWLTGSLRFPVDDAVRAYLEPRWPAGAEEAAIGDVSIFLYPGRRYAVLSVGAVTSSMSYLFEGSAAIRRTFAAVLAEAGGLVALLAHELGEPYERLGPGGEPGPALELPRRDLEDPDGVDAFVEAALGVTPGA